jgi:hypothetical protein
MLTHPRAVAVNAARSQTWGMLLGVCLAGAPYASPPLGSNTHNESQAELVQSYVAAWDGEKPKSNLEALRGLVVDLSSEDPNTSLAARNRLREKVGLEYISTRRGVEAMKSDTPTGRAFLTQDWRNYIDDLETACTRTVRILLRRGTWQTRYERDLAAVFIGERAPHPVFLPLLRTIVANPEDDLSTRVKALWSIALIPHDDLVPYLIEQVAGDLGFHANRILFQLTNANLEFGPEYSPSDERAEWKKWWADHKGAFTYDRMRLMKRH